MVSSILVFRTGLWVKIHAMQLHEAIKKARKELGMSQQKLAGLAGIERKQLSVLENGGNVTLATVRKIVAHLPNMQPFTIGEAKGTVLPTLPPESKAEMALAAEKALRNLLRSLLGTLAEGRLPDEEDMEEEEYELTRNATAARLRPQRAMTEKERAAAMATVNDAIADLNAELENEEEE